MDAKTMVLDKYSARIYKNRKEHIIVMDGNGEIPTIAANARSAPGIITERGCCYAGCKGVVVGPIKDVLTITHGPIGCGFYSWGTRRNQAKASKEGEPVFVQYMFSTDMQEPDIVFGGEKKLRQAIKEAMEIFNPKAIMICSTCPVGLIGDDVQAVATETEKLYGITCIAFSCEGYKGVSQSAGHHIANNGLMKQVIGTKDTPIENPFTVNILGEYNIGGDGFEQIRILNKCGIDVRTSFTGDAAIDDLKAAHMANLNLVMCHRSINYIAEMMEVKYGIPWLKVNFIGLESTCNTLRDIGKFFGDQKLIDRIEAVIAEEMAEVAAEREHYRTRLTGKTAALYVGGSRAHHYQLLLNDFGVKTVLAGYEFAHRDDYEGRDVIPTIKEDADGKNIEHMTVEADPEKYHAYLTPEQLEAVKAEIPLSEYKGMMHGMEEGSLVVDDLNHYETEAFTRILKPDIFFTGVKDKYAIQKDGTMSRQLHSYDYSGPYAGFKGAMKFGHDVVMGLYTPCWGMVSPPWKNRATIEAHIGGGN
ncbi:nitrogenase component I subunit alpha [Youngiibacter fragilis]|uniref:Nitrogenase protein alpha chain n=1 Tax=Youngiibacter fragilis 232.1 TaxID=994573 RepID=V7I5P8_9CLOT|nr:nitrogenase component I subunit alpha [Youngiibacter fragilis]ETA80519.1 nitrogenase molybdenum-iron protein alpha chain [Youngiibacter fragilis 232.1]